MRGRVDAPGGAEVQLRQRARERDEIGDALAQVVARGEHARQVDEVRARGIDLSVRAGCPGGVVLDIEVEGALDRAAGRQAESGVQRVRAGGVQRVAGIGDAVQRQVDGDHDVAGVREGVGHAEHVLAAARDAVLEDHHRPAARRRRRAQRRARVRHGDQHRDLQRLRRHRQRVEARDEGAGGVQREGRRVPVLGERCALAEVVRNGEHADVHIRMAGQAQSRDGRGGESRRMLHGQGLRRGGGGDQLQRVERRLRGEAERQHDLAPGRRRSPARSAAARR